MNRRSFLKVLGGAATALVAAPILTPPSAPLFIPSQNLDYGVPSGRLATASSISTQTLQQLWDRGVARRADGTVPMLLRQSEFLPWAGGKLPAGSVVMVDRETADRWIANDIAVPGPSAPYAMQTVSAKRLAERQQRANTMSWDNVYLDAEELAVIAPVPAVLVKEAPSARLMAEHLIRQASRFKPSGEPLRFDDDEFLVPEGMA